MGSHLCPDKQIIRELQQLQKSQGRFDLFFKDYASQNSVKHEKSLLQNSSINQSLAKQMQRKQNVELISESISNKLIKEEERLQLFKNDTVLHQIIEQQIIFEDGTRYIGQTKDQLPHGQGEEITANGDHFKGHFQNGMKNGFGIYQFHNSERYEGSFVNNKISGRGVYYYSNGDKYQGQFQQNEKHGKGTYYLKQPHKQKLLMFQGCYIKNLKEGKGKLLCLGAAIQGHWLKGVYIFDQNFNSS